MTNWQHHAQQLADDLRAAGDLSSERWYRAVCDTPRHRLVRAFYVQHADASWHRVDAGDPAQFDTVYSDTTLITALQDSAHGPVAVSSSTAPGLMVSMLEALDIQDGHTVLEIGTGTGLNAAYLSHGLGAEQVTSIDLSADLVDTARARLADIGHVPTLIARDGELGAVECGPFDRILSTCSVPAIPWAWIQQTGPGARILADVKPGGLAGNLVLLERDTGGTASGRFLPGWAGFMPMRHDATPEQSDRFHRDYASARERATTAPIEPWLYPVPWFLAQLDAMPAGLTYSEQIHATTGETTMVRLFTSDGSWCELTPTDTGAHVREGGPVSLWEKFERAYTWWQGAGQPDWPRFGLTVAPDAQKVWLDNPLSAHWFLV